MSRALQLVLLLTLCLRFNSGAALAEPPVVISGMVVDGGNQPVADAEFALSDGPFVDVRIDGFYRDVPVPPRVIARTNKSGQR